MSANLPTDYPRLLEDIKERIRTAQVRASLSVNRELILLYWEIGLLIFERQQREGWGAGVIPRLARDLKNELPDVRGFSERNIKRMTRFYREYQSLFPIVPQPVAQIENQTVNVKQLVSQIPWGHKILLMEKVKNLEERLWYMQETIKNGWSRNILALQIKSNAYDRAAKAVTNFERTVPEELKSSLPTIEEIEAELEKGGKGDWAAFS